MKNIHEVLDLEVTMAFIRYAVVVVVKMMLMSAITGFTRMKKKAFANPEDTSSFGKGENAKKFLRTDPDVERIRRTHLNDLENIIPFLFAGFFYSLSGVNLSTALLHFRIFTGSRIFHTIAYLVPLPQPCRGLAWMAGYLVTFSMMYRVIMTVFTVS
ncbi:microsomal glutathione S-transferase 1 [Erythrolamprus reginae]|uniref:microsomal glutathione S-transferase 1 n=1 Tax=Erythrolamprus reginae TaxID=121349 RepID=UPI00396C60DB